MQLKSRAAKATMKHSYLSLKDFPAPGKPELLDQNVTEEEARLYQNGQVLPCPDALSGFLCPGLDGWQLGWAKASQGQMKNHYPKGLRR